jgi:hypothetical protein
MSVRQRSAIAVAAAAVVLGPGWLPGIAWAIDIEPRDYIPFPSGTNLIALYYFFNQYGPLNTKGVTIGGDTHVQSHLGVLRYIYYGDIKDRSYAVQLVVPAGGTRGEIAGQKLASDAGLGDLLLGAGISLLPYPRLDLNVAVVSYTSVPTGNYSPNRVLNLGANRWSEDLQIGYTQAVGEQLWFDAAADAVLYGANGQAGAFLQTLTKQPTYQLQSWLSYVLPPSSLVSVGHSAFFGGAERISGSENGVKSKSQQIRATYTQFLSPSVQLLGSITHDISVVGGFKQKLGLTLRLAHFF